MNRFFESNKMYTLVKNILAFIVVVVMLWTIMFPEGGVFLQEKNSTTWDLSTTSGREVASVGKPVSPYVVKKCGEIKHSDGEIMTICLVSFNGTSGGFYDSNKNLMVVGSFSESTLVHEIFHAASIHNYKKGFTEMLSGATQERMAYDAENLFMQVRAFQEDFYITPDLDNDKKEKLGLPIDKLLAGNISKQNQISTSSAKNSIKKTIGNNKIKV